MHEIINLFNKIGTNPSMEDILEVAIDLETLYKNKEINHMTYTILKQKLKTQIEEN